MIVLIILIAILLSFVPLRCMNNVVMEKMINYFRYTLFVTVFLGEAIVCNAETYPGHCRVTNTLNVRSGPGTSYSKIGKLYPNSYIVVKSTIYRQSRHWGEIDYNNRIGYVAMQYVTYQNPVEPKSQTPQMTITDDSVDIWG